MDIRLTDSDRMCFILDHETLAQKELAEILGYSPSYINNIVKGRERISQDCAKRLSEEFGLNIHWLLTGQGSPYLAEESVTTEEPVVGAEVVFEPHCGECGARVNRRARRCHNCGSYLFWPKKPRGGGGDQL